MPSQTLLTNLLWHTTPAGSHYDWLLQSPLLTGVIDAPVTTFRVATPPSLWPFEPTSYLTPLSPHRKIYLTFSGPLSNGRGFVTQADSGRFQALTWTDSLIVLDVQWRLGPALRCTLAPVNAHGDTWAMSAAPAGRSL